ncbi:hypothetical protein RHOER0001_6434 [Rhodococcus erythropolis SK121]|nr:hypothetical protein RHOER0001_6434 [Rhodococcus erythropolis SK121]
MLAICLLAVWVVAVSMWVVVYRVPVPAVRAPIHIHREIPVTDTPHPVHRSQRYRRGSLDNVTERCDLSGAAVSSTAPGGTQRARRTG